MSENVSSLIPGILKNYGLDARDFEIARLGSGHIHYTFKLSGKNSFILQRVNKNVFKRPEVIAKNIATAASFLKHNFPDYRFLTPRPASDGSQMTYDETGFPWRIFDFIDHTTTADKVFSADQAYKAAASFASVSKNLDGVNTKLFEPTIDRFHDLQWRWEQFQDSLANGNKARQKEAAPEIEAANRFDYLVEEYNRLIDSGDLKLRITHNDTKINNILFDERTGDAVCAIDLDTLMPGYFIYDLGDMIRTFVSPVDEEEKDVSKIAVRKPIYDALIDGYLSEMDSKLSMSEKKAIPFSGMMMTYIMALRMLTDFLNDDVYYLIKYPGQNLVRAKNQFTLLQKLSELPNARGF